jgi:hypothetical protein
MRLRTTHTQEVFESYDLFSTNTYMNLLFIFSKIQNKIDFLFCKYDVTATFFFILYYLFIYLFNWDYVLV